MIEGYPVSRAVLATVVAEMMEGVTSCPINDILITAIDRQPGLAIISRESEVYTMIRVAHNTLLTSVLKGFKRGEREGEPADFALLEEYYRVRRLSNEAATKISVLVRLDHMTDDEVDEKCDEHRKQGKGHIDHSDRLASYREFRGNTPPSKPRREVPPIPLNALKKP